MADLFASGRIVDLILALVAVEAILLMVFRRQVRRRTPLWGLVTHLASGACLLIALRIALVQGWWGWVGLALGAALACHLVALGPVASRTPGP